MVASIIALNSMSGTGKCNKMITVTFFTGKMYKRQKSTLQARAKNLNYVAEEKIGNFRRLLLAPPHPNLAFTWSLCNKYPHSLKQQALPCSLLTPPTTSLMSKSKLPEASRIFPSKKLGFLTRSQDRK